MKNNRQNIYIVLVVMLALFTILCFPYIKLKDQIISSLIILSAIIFSYFIYLWITIHINNVKKKIPKNNEEYEKLEIQDNLASYINSTLTKETILDRFLSNKFKYKTKLNNQQVDFLIKTTEEKMNIEIEKITDLDIFNNYGLTLFKEDDKYYLNICKKYIKFNESFMIGKNGENGENG